MRFSNCQYLEKEGITVSVRNNNTTAAILDGMPVFYDPFDTATYLGVDVHSFPTALGSSPIGLACGIAKAFNINDNGTLVAGEVGEAFAYGFTDAIVLVNSRTASSLTWASFATIGAGDQLVPETTNGYLKWQGTLAASGLAIFMAGQSMTGSSTTAASTFMGAALVNTTRMKVFVNCM